MNTKKFLPFITEPCRHLYHHHPPNKARPPELPPPTSKLGLTGSINSWSKELPSVFQKHPPPHLPQQLLVPGPTLSQTQRLPYLPRPPRGRAHYPQRPLPRVQLVSSEPYHIFVLSLQSIARIRALPPQYKDCLLNFSRWHLSNVVYRGASGY